MIKIKNLLFSYGDSGFSLNIPDLTIAQSERVAITGPSGTGKTTLLNLMSGLLQPQQGSIVFDELEMGQFSTEDLQDLRIIKMGMIFQEFELLDYLTVFDNILLPYRINPALKITPDITDRAVNIARQVGLGDKLKRRPARLSQGERQRTAVCRAILTNPAVIFGDEPTGNLDPANRDNIMDIIFDYCIKVNAPLIIVSHDSELLSRFDRKINVQEYTQ